MGHIIPYKQIEKFITEIKQSGYTIILAGGCFDILHIGHIEFLDKAKELGGKLIILLESDDSIRKIKGKNRPVNSQADRAVLLSKLSMIDYVIPLPPLTQNDDYLHLVKLIKPDIIAITKGDTKKQEKLHQANSVQAKLVEVIDIKKNYSTSNIIKEIKSDKT